MRLIDGAINQIIDNAPTEPNRFDEGYASGYKDGRRFEKENIQQPEDERPPVTKAKYKRPHFFSSPTEAIKVGEPVSNSDEINKALEKGDIYRRGFEDGYINGYTDGRRKTEKDIRWTDKVTLDSFGKIRDFDGNIVGEYKITRTEETDNENRGRHQEPNN